MENKYVECACGTDEHTIKFGWFEDDIWPEMYVTVFLNPYLGFFRRVWYGIRYIFGHRSRTGCFDTTALSHKQVKQVRDICNHWLETHPEEASDGKE